MYKLNRILAKRLVIAASLSIICLSVWGINESFQLAKANRLHYLRFLEWSQNPMAVPASLPTDRDPYITMQTMGLEGTPHYFNAALRKIMSVFLLCLVLSVVVMYSALKANLGPRPRWINWDPDTVDDEVNTKPLS